MLATKLIVTVAKYPEHDPEDTEEKTYEFEAYELANGLISISSHDTNDWFFEDRESIQASGYDSIIDVTVTESVTNWNLKDLRKTIKASLKEFGSVPQKALAMLG